MLEMMTADMYTYNLLNIISILAPAPLLLSLYVKYSTGFGPGIIPAGQGRAGTPHYYL